jgi:2-polyprenyl-3-methyl-5-hydroxy-6-metoxy-1,4-benzoquinol methylase
MTTIEMEPDVGKIEEFAGRMFGSGIGALELLTTELGLRLGYYEVLRDQGPVTSTELAAVTGTTERYAREWLEQQACAGVLEVDGDRRFTLPVEHAIVILDGDTEAYAAPIPGLVVRFSAMLDAVEDAFKTGGGVPFADYGIHDLQAALTRPTFLTHLVDSWLPALPDIHAKLLSGTARIAEIGCGEGVAGVRIATAFPGVHVAGFDLDDASIAAARRHAAEAGVADRVRFEVVDGSQPIDGDYDLVFCVEMLHDTSNPIGILSTMRAAGDVVLVVDERAEETFTAPGPEFERLLYSASVLHCLPAGMAQQPSAATGTVIRPATIRRYAAAAGFTKVEVLAVDHPQFRLYRMEG